MRYASPVALLAALVATSAHAQSNSVLVDCTGASISAFLSPSDVVRTSTDTILPAQGYQFAFNPIVTGTGVAGSLLGTNQPLAFGMNNISVGGQRVLFGAVRNPSGTLPTRLDFYAVTQIVSGLTISLTLDHEILPDGRVRASIRDVQRPFGSIGLNVNSGGLQVNTWTPPPAAVSEWHFDGDLLSVKQSGLAPTSGPAKLRYLDDAAFGPILGGQGNLDNYPTTPTPTGVTLAQSAFGTTTAFGIPNIGTDEDTVWRTSPPRNASSPTDTALSRGLGLALFPNTRDYWPEDRHGQWTFVWDLYIPQTSWTAALADSTDGNICIPLVEDSSNNNSQCDMFLRVAGTGSGQAGIGYVRTRTDAISAPAIAPNQWFRLAVSVDHYGKKQSRIFVNGAFVGTTGSSWLYNACKSSAPTWGDAAPGNPTGTPVDAATWNAWGQFPSPWAKSTTATPAPMSSTLSLFADLFGNGQTVYVANMLFTDEAMSDAQITALGAPNARGIIHLRPPVTPPCAADFNGTGGLTVQDIFDFLNAWFAGTPTADFNGQNGITVQDIFDFLNAWFAGC